MNKDNNCKKNFVEFFTKDNYENTLIYILLTLNTINLIYCLNTKLCIPITILLFFIYFCISKKSIKNKKKLILVWLSFSIFTLFGESTVILYRSKSLKYFKSDLFNVSSWLFSAYANMVLFILFLNDYYNNFL